MATTATTSALATISPEEQNILDILESPESKNIALFEAGISLVEDYLSFDPDAEIPQRRRLFFIGMGERESIDPDTGLSKGPKPAALFLDPIAEKRMFGMQGKLVGVLQKRLESENPAEKIWPGMAMEVVFTGMLKRKKAAGHYQNFEIYPLRPEAKK